MLSCLIMFYYLLLLYGHQIVIKFALNCHMFMTFKNLSFVSLLSFLIMSLFWFYVFLFQSPDIRSKSIVGTVWNWLFKIWLSTLMAWMRSNQRSSTDSSLNFLMASRRFSCSRWTTSSPLPSSRLRFLNPWIRDIEK